MNLRTRVLLLVLLALLPPVLLLLYTLFDHRLDRINEAKRDLSAHARGTAHDLEYRLRSAALFAQALASDPALETPDRAACSATLASIARRFPDFGILATIRPNGDLHCNSVPEWARLRLNVADRGYFRRALTSPEAQFDALLSRVTGEPVVFVAYAARDRAGQVRFVLTVTINLDRFITTAAGFSPYADTIATLWDRRDATLLARHPEAREQKLSGRKYPQSDLFRFVHDAGDGGTTEIAGVDDVERVYALAELPRLHELGLRLTLGVARAELIAEADWQLRYALLFSGVLLVLAVVSVWLFAERSIRRPAARILETVERFAAGDLAARIGRPYARGEVGHLMEALDATADTLQRQRRELDEFTAGLERRVAERTAELQLAQREQERILNTVDFGIHGIGRDGNIFFENPAAAALFGCNASEMIGRPAHATVHHSRADGTPYPQSDCPIYATLRDGDTRRVKDEVFWRKDGTSFPVAYTSTPLYDETGDRTGALVAFRDVTFEREVERMKNEFVATVSHELRTPLASLLGFSELMLTRTLPEEKNRKFLGVIHKESKRLNTLINDFLDLQRVESGRVSYTLEPLDLAGLVREVAMLFSSDAQHSLRLDLAEALPLSLGDHDRIKQVLQNLLSNAVKYSPQGGEIVIAARATGDGEVEVSVTDHGLGIPAEAIPKLFGKFYRVDSSDRREIGGTGLGLALCKEIVSAHKGRIWAESRLGEGTTFRFTLPVDPVATPPAAAPAPVAAIKADKGYVLIVEDDVSFAALVREHLAEARLKARIEASAEGALETARLNAPLLVILDIHLAGKMDGWDFLTEIKGEAALASVPVIITTVTDRRERGIALGASDYLIKPFPMEALVGAVRRCLPLPRDCRVLVVDDDPNFRASIAAILAQNLQCHTEEAGDGKQALEQIRRRPPDLVILDLLMPVMDGFAVLDLLRARTETASLPVLVVTGKQLSVADKAHLTHGMARVFTKERYSSDKLLTLVRELLARRETS